MGWAGGSYVMADIISVVQTSIPNQSLRERLYVGIIDALERNDWDTQDECLGQDPAFDAAMEAVWLGRGE